MYHVTYVINHVPTLQHWCLFLDFCPESPEILNILDLHCHDCDLTETEAMVFVHLKVGEIVKNHFTELVTTWKGIPRFWV